MNSSNIVQMKKSTVLKILFKNKLKKINWEKIINPIETLLYIIFQLVKYEVQINLQKLSKQILYTIFKFQINQLFQFIINQIYYTQTNMLLIQTSSPFVEQARNYQLNKRRTSKKIRKMSATFAKMKSNPFSKILNNNSRESQLNNILSILNQRAVPSFLIELVKKKRIFNIGSIKKMTISAGGIQQDLHEIDIRCKKQEQELQGILLENKTRFELRKKLSNSTPTRPITRAQNQTNSSTLSLQSEQEQELMDQDIQAPSVSMFNNIMDFQESMEYIRPELDDEDIFLKMF